MPTCMTCTWWSTGFNDPKGAGYCYSEGDYTPEDGHCDFWQESMRDDALKPPEACLVEQVAKMDVEVED